MNTGIHTMAADAYHADTIANVPSLSRSIAHKLLVRSPRHAWYAHPRLNPEYVAKESGTLDNGSAAHMLLFEGKQAEIVDADSWRTNAAQEERTAARRAGKLALLKKDAVVVQAMCDAISEQLDALDDPPRPFTDGKAEQTLVWEEAGGVVCRARLDWLRDDHTQIADLKTTGASANPREWTRRRLWEDGLDIQAGFYRRGVKKLTGVTPEWRFVVVENSPPYALSVVSLTPEAIALADAKVEKAIAIWRECLTTGEWPAYPTRVCYAELPPWEEARWLEREALEEMAETVAA